MHAKKLVHRDIKPDNFLMGLEGETSNVFMVDFGLAKCYIDKKTKKHISLAKNKSLTGTARYASANAHKGYELSRRDDLEALGNMALYFYKGRLPW